MDNLGICRMTAWEMRETISAGELSPVEAVNAVLDRIEQLNPKVNAYCTVVADSAREEARQAEARVLRKEELGPLHGVPVSIKDLVFTRGIRTTGGSRLYEDFIPEQDSIVVERLKKAGAIVIGKTNTPEFGWVAVTDNDIFGPTRNPWNLECTPGGSSGGAACAVALSMGPLAIGSDGGGSIRIPSSLCGVFGIKPSYGRVPAAPGFPGLWEGLSVAGPITRTVRDAALAMEIIAGRDDRDHFSLPDTHLSYLPLLDSDLKGLRIAWSPDLGYATVDEQVLKVTEAAMKTFAGLGCVVETATPDTDSPQDSFAAQVAASVAAFPGSELEKSRDRITPDFARFIERNLNMMATDYLKARVRNIEYSSRIQAFFAEYDLLLTPTVAVPAFEIGIPGPREIAGTRVAPLGWMPFTYPFNITGQPAASVPCGWTDNGLPVGLQIVGRRFDEGTVLKAAAAFERAAPWADRYPPLG
jgi:aspartyl-tRNA(Asn)/glutamyl-tRNA(Gln) amidotransferase subunit A